jgi:hypothetical protein
VELRERAEAEVEEVKERLETELERLGETRHPMIILYMHILPLNSVGNPYPDLLLNPDPELSLSDSDPTLLTDALFD